MARVLAIIPARYGSARLPGKPLLDATGKYLVQHVYERVRSCALIDRVMVATDDDRIARACNKFGAVPIMTESALRTGTDRVAAAIVDLDRCGVGRYDLVLNVQGDQPEVDPVALAKLVEAYNPPWKEECPDEWLGTMVTPLGPGDRHSPHTVKAICHEGRVLYFTRAAVPGGSDGAALVAAEAGSVFKHVGVYAYTPTVLDRLAAARSSVLEVAEGLEQLRLPSQSWSYVEVAADAVGGEVNTPADYAAFINRYRNSACPSKTG